MLEFINKSLDRFFYYASPFYLVYYFYKFLDSLPGFNLLEIAAYFSAVIAWFSIMFYSSHNKYLRDNNGH